MENYQSYEKKNDGKYGGKFENDEKYENGGKDNGKFENGGKYENGGKDDKKKYEKLAGAKFVLIDKCGKEILCGVTNECGELEFEGLPFGKYLLKEIEAPYGYEKSDKCVEVCIGDDSRHRCVEFFNEKKKGSIKVIKFGC